MHSTLAKFCVIFILFAACDAMSGDATYYNLGLTACGQVFTDNDYVAAIAFSYWTTPNPNNDPMCRKRARVTDPASGKSVNVAIKDKCAGCKRGDIDLSPVAFEKLRNKSVGRFKVVLWPLYYDRDDTNALMDRGIFIKK